MKTTSQVIADSNISPTLIRAVVRTVGRESIIDLARHGADAGFSGLTYTRDCVAFYKRHKKAILALAEDMASDLGQDMLEMIARFNCLRDYNLSPYEVARAIDGKGEDADTVQNALAWFAAEEVARSFDE